MSDPLMPTEHRFPRDPSPMPLDDEPPSAVRPFVLRGLTTGRAAPVARHRTPATRVPAQPVPMTTSDGKHPRSVPDPYYVPDD